MADFNINASPLITNGVPQYNSYNPAPVAGTQALPASQANPTAFSPVPNVSGGGVVDDFKGAVGNAVTAITATVQRKMDEMQSEMQALFNSEGGPMDAAKLQVYSQKMSAYERAIEMAAKIQDKEERMTSVWTRP